MSPSRRRVGTAGLALCLAVLLTRQAGAEEIYGQTFESAPVGPFCRHTWGDKPQQVLANGVEPNVGRDGSKAGRLQLVFGTRLKEKLSYWQYDLPDPVPVVEELQSISFWVKGNVPVSLKVHIAPYGYIYHGPSSKGEDVWEKVELADAYAKLSDWCARSGRPPGMINGIIFAVSDMKKKTADLTIDDLLLSGPPGAAKAVQAARLLKQPHTGRINFDLNSTNGWRFSKYVKKPVTCENGIFKIEAIGDDPYMQSPPVRVNGDQVSTIVVRMRGRGDRGQFFWTTEDSPKETGDKGITFPIKDGEMSLYRIEMGEHPRWKGKIIKSIRLDPCMETFPSTAEVDYIKDEGALGGRALRVDTGPLRLEFEEYWPQMVTIRCGGRALGTLQCLLAQFEKEGLGYKSSGIGAARATSVKEVKPVKKEDGLCIVDVTVERTLSEERMRKFEATYRFTVHAGRSWFEGRLLRVKNTDTVPFGLKGYYHLLQPASMVGTEARCYPEMAAWVGKSGLLGAVARSPGEFTLGLRKISETARGEITRKVSSPQIEPGKTWEADEPAIVIFGGSPGTEEALAREYGKIKPLLSSPSPQGRIRYDERKPTK